MKNLEVVHLQSEEFTVFSHDYSSDKYSQLDIKFLYLKGCCDYPIHYISKMLSLRYAEALKLAKNLSDEINNIRTDKRLVVLHEEKATSDRLLVMRARQIKAIHDEMERRASDPERFRKTSEKQLLEMLEKLESSVQFENEYYTGELDTGSFPKEKLNF
jgi:hypothetical protein